MEDVAEVIGQNFGAVLAVLGTLGGSLLGILASRVGARTDERRRHVLASGKEQAEYLARIMDASNALYAAMHTAITATRAEFKRSGVTEGKIQPAIFAKATEAADDWRAALAHRHWIDSQEVADATGQLDRARGVVVLAMNNLTLDDAAKAFVNFELAMRHLSLVMNLARIDGDIAKSEVLDSALQRRKKKQALGADRESVLLKLSEVEKPYE